MQTDELLSVFQHLANCTGVDLETIRLIIGGKEYRVDQEEVHKKIKDVGIENKHTLFMVVRLKGGYEFSQLYHHLHLMNQFFHYQKQRITVCI